MDENKGREGEEGGSSCTFDPFLFDLPATTLATPLTPHQWRTIDVVVLSKYIFLSSWHSRWRFFICVDERRALVSIFFFPFFLSFFFLFSFWWEWFDSVCLTMMDGDRGDRGMWVCHGLMEWDTVWECGLSVCLGCKGVEFSIVVLF